MAFDTDLLRVAAVWQGAGVTPRALAPGSYHAPDKKTPGGQNALPEPDGTVWMANGIYPGWQEGERRASTTLGSLRRRLKKSAGARCPRRRDASRPSI